MISSSHLTDPMWKKKLNPLFNNPTIIKLIENLAFEENYYPQESEVFTAFNLTPFNKVKVVIIGQDPYHGIGQAHGLSFSVQSNTPIPRSLKNIFQELKNDLGFSIPDHGNLSEWAKQGVLLINNVLTVKPNTPGSHRKLGWEFFTDKVVEILNEEKSNLVFLLWGNDAKSKGLKIDRKKHLVLESAHPSPFSVKNFLGNRHFSKTNEYLIANKIKPIHWQISNLFLHSVNDLKH